MFNNIFTFLDPLGAILAQHGCKNNFNCFQNAFRMPRRASKMPTEPSKRPQAVSNHVKMPSPRQVLAKSLPDCKIRQKFLPTMVNHRCLLQRPCLSTKGGLAVVRPRRATSKTKLHQPTPHPPWPRKKIKQTQTMEQILNILKL